MGRNIKEFYKLLNLLYVLFHNPIVIFNERKFPNFKKLYFLLCTKFYEGVYLSDGWFLKYNMRFFQRLNKRGSKEILMTTEGISLELGVACNLLKTQ